jgi:hypothetical protein
VIRVWFRNGDRADMPDGERVEIDDEGAGLLSVFGGAADGDDEADDDYEVGPPLVTFVLGDIRGWSDAPNDVVMTFREGRED